nr:Tubulin polyglutamylase ttll5 [Polyrhizophydium stewartii]
MHFHLRRMRNAFGDSVRRKHNLDKFHAHTIDLIRQHFSFVPQTFLLPLEYRRFYDEYLRVQGQWIVRPLTRSLKPCGSFKINSLVELPTRMHDERYLIQRAVTNELSVLGESICVKYFVAVTSFAPLRVYIHSEALVSFGRPIGQLKTHLLKSFTIEQLHFMEKQVHDMVIKTLISAADIIGLATRSNMPSP